MKMTVAALLAVGTLVFAVPASAQSGTSAATEETDINGLALLAPNDRITRLYRAALGREPDIAGHAYWVDQIDNGASLLGLTRSLMSSEEAQNRSTGDPLRDAYLWALGREPDTSGYDYWSRYDAARAVLFISDSAEHKVNVGLEVIEGPFAPLESPSAPAGWVDAGHGVYVPPILLEIRRCESGHDYQAANRRSSARGAYQFLASSWAAYGHAQRYGVFEAHRATNAEQDEAAVITWKRDGVRPWYASRSCWG